MQAKAQILLRNLTQSAEQTGLSPWTLRRWAYDGKIASHKLGTRLMIPQSELDRLISESFRPRFRRRARDGRGTAPNVQSPRGG